MGCIAMSKIIPYIEKYSCILLAFVVTYVMIKTSPFPLTKDTTQFFIDLFTTYATISSLLAGLLTTATSNFFSHTKLICLLKKHHLFQQVLIYSQRATISNCVALCFSFILIFAIKFYQASTTTRLIYYSWGFVAGYSFSAFVRASYIFTRSSKIALELEEK